MLPLLAREDVPVEIMSLPYSTLFRGVVRVNIKSLRSETLSSECFREFILARPRATHVG